jgi:alpha-amylase
MNHDTQFGQILDTPIERFFKPLAYSLILLRKQGYPCIFYGDLYGIKGKNPEPPSCGDKLADIMLVRTLYAYGEQNDYFEEPSCIGWVRPGTWDKPDGLACIMSIAGSGHRRMSVGKEHTGETWTDVLEWEQGKVQIDEEGYGLFHCPPKGVAIWVNSTARERHRFPLNFNSDIYRK